MTDAAARVGEHRVEAEQRDAAVRGDSGVDVSRAHQLEARVRVRERLADATPAHARQRQLPVAVGVADHSAERAVPERPRLRRPALDRHVRAAAHERPPRRAVEHLAAPAAHDVHVDAGDATERVRPADALGAAERREPQPGDVHALHVRAGAVARVRRVQHGWDARDLHVRVGGEQRAARCGARARDRDRVRAAGADAGQRRQLRRPTTRPAPRRSLPPSPHRRAAGRARVRASSRRPAPP